MDEYRYILEKSSRKFICPACGKKSFVKYIDTESGEYLPSQYGRCDREDKCRYFLNPYSDNYTINNEEATVKPTANRLPVFIPDEVLKQTLSGYEQNIFIQNLISRVPFPFEVPDIEKIIALYRLGTVQHGYRTGAITFPFVDIKNKVRAIQVKQFDETNHTTGTDFLHSIIEKYHIRNNKPLPEWLQAYNKNDKRVSCLFGEHLLSKYPQNPVALVEAPKTAIYGTLYFGFPDTENLLWLAVYNKSSFSFDKIKVLKGRTVYIFPDLSKDGSTFKEWEQKAKDYEKQLPDTKFIFSDLIEQIAPKKDKINGHDIADFLIKLDWKGFAISEYLNKTESRQHTHGSNQYKSAVCPNETDSKYPREKAAELTGKGHATISKINTIFKSEHEDLKKKVDNWDKQISELETYFSNIKLPTNPVKLNDWTTITDPIKFIDSSLAFVKYNNGNKTFLPYLISLQQFKNLTNDKATV